MPSRPFIAAFLLLPVLEILAVLGVVHLLGGWPTLALLLAGSALGGWIVRREGRRAWRTLQDAARGVPPAVPGKRAGDAPLVMAGGLLLLLPGFVSDVAGAFTLLPPTRPLVRRAFARFTARRAAAAPGLGDVLGGGFPPEFGFPGAPRADGDAPRGPVVRGEVLRDEPGDGSGDLRARP
ncbi:FxsA family protein [Actinomadura atramentaria]|uniref:FxsA family protein n=1 Tax=Actinomadura atramentaria TaxID=1990 RepID=UPI000360EBD7|nr:FxsA family protein [Actinomadura atramentaria]